MIQNRINKLFQDKKERIMSVYFTAGYPQLDDTVSIIKGLEQNGVDLIEIGMPFSDPVADGPVIQNSSHIALDNGMSVKKLFEQLEGIRKEVDTPLILMGYLNPVLQFGVENFCIKCKETGIDGLIIPDLPLDIYKVEYRELFEKYNLHNILLISPQTSDKRLKEVDHISGGFIYMVSGSSTTGIKTGISFSDEYFARIQQMNLKNPRLIGFGVSNRETFEAVCRFSHGAIIGSAFINALSAEGELGEKIEKFVHTFTGV